MILPLIAIALTIVLAKAWPDAFWLALVAEVELVAISADVAWVALIAVVALPALMAWSAFIAVVALSANTAWAAIPVKGRYLAFSWSV